MSRIEMTIDSPPVSLNHKLVPVRGRLVPNPALKKPIEDINNIINFKYRKHLTAFMLETCPLKQFYSLELYICVPKNKFFTKLGTMNQNVADGDNCVKVLKDAIFPKALGLNDFLVKRDMVMVIPYDGDRTQMKVILEEMNWSDWL